MLKFQLLLLLFSCVQIFADENGVCLQDVEKYRTDLAERKPWALQMFDSSTKIPDGMLHGNLFHLGNFDECLRVENIDEFGEKLTGKWCRLSLNNASLLNPRDEMQDLMFLPLQYAVVTASKNANNLEDDDDTRIGFIPTLNPRVQWSVCAPASCVAEGIEEVMRINMERVGLSVDADVLNKTCFSYGDENYDFEASSWAFVGVASLLICVVIASTAFEVYEHFQLIPAGNPPKHVAFSSFSVWKNLRELFHVPRRANPGMVTCLNGMRVLSLAWVIMGHRYSIMADGPVINAIDFVTYREHWSNMIVLNAFLSVETFFFMGGFLATYVASSNAMRGRPFSLLQYYVYRYIRLTVPLALYVFYIATMSDRVSHGPMWDYTLVGEASRCRDRWWATLLYVNNYADKNLCAGQSWYLSVDMQLSIAAPFIIIPLLKWPKQTLAAIGVLTLCSAAGIVAVTVVYELRWQNPITVIRENSANYWQYLYRQTPLRAVPYLIGMASGYMISRPHTYRHDRFPWWAWPLGWIINTAACLAIVFTLAIACQRDYEYSTVDAAFYASLHRIGWGLGMAWIVFACVAGHGGPVDKILSWRGFVPLSKLTYCAFLMHYYLILMSGGHRRNPQYFSNFLSVHAFFGDLFFTFVLTLGLYLLTEAPTATLLRAAFAKDKFPKKKDDEETIVKKTNETSTD